MAKSQAAQTPSITAVTDEVERVTVRFAGDSGDGMQLTGNQFTRSTALSGYDLATLPDYPAEIRAPAGTLPGVSAFQIQFASGSVFTPGDAPDVLVAMNAAALKKNISELNDGGLILANSDGFNKKDLEKAGYTADPLGNGSLDSYRLLSLPITTLTEKALDGSALSIKDRRRSKNLFALGLIFWLFERDRSATEEWIHARFGKVPDVMDANLAALKAGHMYGDVNELDIHRYRVPHAHLEPGTYRNITGNTAVANGLVVAAKKAELTLYLGSYPITPASDILHALAKLRNYGVITFQAEDEIAAVCSAIGASYAGALAVTSTSGPGLALKSEAIGLAVMTELPLVVINVQRGGPSTGLPTKTEQADLLQVMYGRNGECPVAVIAARSPGDAFYCAYEAARIALKYMTPVILLSDGYIANGAEPWKLPDLDALVPMEVSYRKDPEGFKPYMRDPKTLARPWAIPGTPGLIHRIGGLEKEDVTGNVSYDPMNHDKMCRLRAEKVQRIQNDIPPCLISGPEAGKMLVVGWGSTYGATWEAVRRLQAAGEAVSHLHLRWLNPFPADLGEILGRFDHVLVPEINLGQLVKMLRAEYLVDAIGFHLVRGQPFRASEIAARIRTLL